jgi:hypothetical protein
MLFGGPMSPVEAKERSGIPVSIYFYKQAQGKHFI